jgi:hypothetical protein
MQILFSMMSLIPVLAELFHVWKGCVAALWQLSSCVAQFCPYHSWSSCSVLSGECTAWSALWCGGPWGHHSRNEPSLTHSWVLLASPACEEMSKLTFEGPIGENEAWGMR